MTSQKHGATRWLAFGAGVAALALTANAHADRLAFRPGTSSGTVVFGGDNYTFSPSNSAAWGYSFGYATSTPQISAVLNLSGLPGNADATKSWLAFRNLFGNGTGQIPFKSTITKAVLHFKIYTSGARNVNVEFHRIVDEANTWVGNTTDMNWRYRVKSTATSWTKVVGGNAAHLGEAVSAMAESVHVATPAGESSPEFDLAVTNSLRAWAASGAGDNQNLGWAIYLDANQSVSIQSPSSAGTRPTLYVEYTPYQPDGTVVIVR